MRTLTLFVLLAYAGAQARELPFASAESVGMSSARLQAITELSRRYVDEGKLANVVTMVARRGNVVHFEAVGRRGVADDGPVKKDDLFRIYSMSKPITAVAAMILYEEGRFQTHDPVSKFLPELENLTVLNGEAAVALETPITMQQLLSHTAGFTYGFGRENPVDRAYQDGKILESTDLNEFVTKVAQIPLLYQPGTRFHYSIAVRPGAGGSYRIAR